MLADSLLQPWFLNANDDNDGVEVGVAAKNATSLANDLTKWFFKVEAEGKYRISLAADATYLAASSATEMTINSTAQAAAHKAKDTWVVATNKLGAVGDGGEAPACTDKILFASTPEGNTVKLNGTGSDIAFYAESYDYDAGTGLLNAVDEDDYVFITIGGKYVKVKEIPAGGANAVAEIELVSELKTVEDKYLATFQASADARTTYTSIALRAAGKNNKILRAGEVNNPLTVDTGGTTFYYDNSDKYEGVKGASLYTAEGAENYIDVDGKTTAIGTTKPADRPEVKIYASSQILMAPGAVSAEDFVSGNRYLLSTDGVNFLKLTDPTTLENTTTPDENALWEVKETVNASGDYSYTLYNVGQKIYLKLGSSTTFMSAVSGQGYTGGIKLQTGDTKLITYVTADNSWTTKADRNDVQVLGFYNASNERYTAGELSAVESDGFSISIATAKKDGKTDIEGADVFSGKLTPSGAKGDKVFQLKNKDGKYIVLNKKSAWGKLLLV